MPITIPDKVKIDFKPGLVDVTGPLGHVVQAIPRGITLKIDKNQATVETTAEGSRRNWKLSDSVTAPPWREKN
jgi:large subunit ribosomal protein L6